MLFIHAHPPNSAPFFSPCMFYTAAFPPGGWVCSASPTDACSAWQHSLLSHWVSCWSPLLLHWSHASPAWSVQGAQDPVWHFVPPCHSPEAAAGWPLTFVAVSHSGNSLLLLVDCFWVVLWANSMEQWKPWRQGQAQFQVLGQGCCPGEGRGSGWAIQVGTVGQ